MIGEVPYKFSVYCPGGRRGFGGASEKCYICSVIIFKTIKVMKGLNVLAAFLGGAAVGAALGILFAPEKGEDTRHKIAEILRKKGIKLNRNEMEDLVDEIAAELKEVTE